MPNLDAELAMPRRSLRSPAAVKSNKRDLEECATEGRMTRSKIVPFDWAPLAAPLPTLALFDEVDEADEDEASDVDFVPESEDTEVVAEEFDEDVGDEFETVAERGELSLEADEEAKPADATLLAELADAEKENDEDDDEFECVTRPCPASR